MKTIYLIIISLILFFSCQRNGIVLCELFNEEEITEVDKIIQYYDSFIRVQTDYKGEDISHAYQTFLQLNTILAQEGNDMDVLRPSLNMQNALFSTMKSEFIEEIFQLKAFYDHIGSHIEDSNPPLHITPNGKFVKYLQELAKINPLFAPCAKELSEKGDVGVECYRTLLTKFAQIDFNNKDERFAFIVCMLRRA